MHFDAFYDRPEVFLRFSCSISLSLFFQITNIWPICNFWSTRPITVPASSDHYFHTGYPFVCKSDRPKTSKSIENNCRPGLWSPSWIINASCFVLSYFSEDIDLDMNSWLWRQNVGLPMSKTVGYLQMRLQPTATSIHTSTTLADGSAIMSPTSRCPSSPSTWPGCTWTVTWRFTRISKPLNISARWHPRVKTKLAWPTEAHIRTWSMEA